MAEKLSIPVKDRTGAEVGRYEFDPAELAPSINKQLLHDVVVMYQANQRVGTMQSRSRGMVVGSKNTNAVPRRPHCFSMCWCTPYCHAQTEETIARLPELSTPHLGSTLEL